MSALVVTFAATVSAGASEGTHFGNPIIPGFAPDPSVVRVGEDFYLVNSTFEYFPGIPVYHSTDLVNWTLISHALQRPSQIDLRSVASSGGVHASTIRYHEGTFYVITTNVLADRPVNFIVTAKDPHGPWSEAQVLEGAPGIDPSLMFDDDGRTWYVGNHAPADPAFPGEMEIWLQELDIDAMALVGERYFLWRGCCQGAWAEGPHIYKRNGHYYLLISEGGTAYEHALSVAISKNIRGPYENNPRNPILTHRQLSYGQPITGVGHADFVELEDGRWYAVALGWRLVDGLHGILGRETFLVPLEWETEPYWWKEPKITWPVISPETGRIELEFPMPFEGTSQQADAGFDESFDSTELALEWNFRRTHDEPIHSLTDRPGTLRLFLQPEHIGEHKRYSFVGVRQRHFQYEAQARMEFVAASAHEEAGLTVIQNDRAAIFMTVSGQGDDRRVRVYRKLQGNVTEIASTALSTDAVYLKVVGDYLALDFLFSGDGRDWVMLAEDVDATSLSPAVIHGYNYTGMYIGVFASSNGQATDSFADFESFNYRPTSSDRNAWYDRQRRHSDSRRAD